MIRIFQTLVLLWGVSAGLTNPPEDSLPWAMKPLAVVEPPVSEAGKNPVDYFVHSRLQKEGLSPAPSAEKRTLLRRLYFTLTGLPPSPAEARQFEGTADEASYQAALEKLLASPRYGERWARHWLDVVRFAETHGFEMNQPRSNAWPYRDYVIRAFNQDLPYDQFVLQQLAGDLVGVDEATGFLVAGPWDQVTSPDPVLTANQRADELHDIVSTTSSTFLGLTVGCARCHNHKFDPIPQTDYFKIKAVFEGVKHGDRKWRDEESARKAQELASNLAELDKIEQQLDEFEPVIGELNALRVSVNARRNVERFEPAQAKKVRFTVRRTNNLEPCIDELEIYTPEGQNAALARTGTIARASSTYPNSDIHRLEHINDGQHGNSRSWISHEMGGGWVELELAKAMTISRIVWGRDREQKYTDRLPVDYLIEVSDESGHWRTVATSDDRAPFNTPAPAPPAKAKVLASKRETLEKRVAELRREKRVYAGTFQGTPEKTFRWHRGDPMLPREPVEPGALSVLNAPLECGSSGQTHRTEDQRRRLAFAQWITGPAAPLAARVMVNRIWQYHFGEGLVSTASDFGANGTRPTHPELLDWLAAEFVKSGWSIKHMHRLILSSATFRQSSAARPEGLEKDAGTRLLWRFPPRRLEAEALRDSILAVSGQLNLKAGGPGFSFFEPNDNYVRVYNPRVDWPEETLRRMVYGTVVRLRPDGVFGVFDCPDAGQIAPKRTSSTTPLQALNLLNSSFIVQQANALAARLSKAGSEPEAQVRTAFQTAFLREPDAEELEAAKQLIASQGLPAFARALFNANEFLYLL